MLAYAPARNKHVGARNQTPSPSPVSGAGPHFGRGVSALSAHCGRSLHHARLICAQCHGVRRACEAEVLSMFAARKGHSIPRSSTSVVHGMATVVQPLYPRMATPRSNNYALLRGARARLT